MSGFDVLFRPSLFGAVGEAVLRMAELDAPDGVRMFASAGSDEALKRTALSQAPDRNSAWHRPNEPSSRHWRRRINDRTSEADRTRDVPMGNFDASRISNRHTIAKGHIGDIRKKCCSKLNSTGFIAGERNR
jgi:hypothetical protein